MKIIFVFLIILSTPKQCGKTEIQTLPFISATSQLWYGGAAATRGTYYNVYLAMSKDSNFVFDSLWVENKRLPVAIKRSANDTLHIFVNDAQGFRNPVDGSDFPKVEEQALPITSQAEGILGCFYKGNRRYFEIPAFTKLKPMYYQ